MGKNTGIEWTDHTLNFWWGCFKVSPGCANCYAETFSKRVGRHIWGPAQTTERWRTKAPWLDCLKWDKQAQADGIRRNAFCQSMSDFFEDQPQVEPWRKEACQILEGFKWLNVQLLTKRIENVLEMVPQSWLRNWPPHIWIGTSVENQEYADLRIPYLLRIPARVRFLSCEPMLGPVDLGFCLNGYDWSKFPDNGDGVTYPYIGPNWVIVGGESGHGARVCSPVWVRSLRDQCKAAGIPFFFKQWGQFLHTSQMIPGVHYNEAEHRPTGDHFVKVTDKHYAGNLLDGVKWSEFPK